MNKQYNQILPQSKSYHHLHQHHYQPLSPLNKIATPHKLRNNTFNSSMNTTPINFSTALNNFKSPNNQENMGSFINQSPILNKFNIDHRDMSNERNRSPYLLIDNKKKAKLAKNNQNRSQAFDQGDSQNNQTQYRNFQSTLMSLAKSPQLQNKMMRPKKTIPNKLKGILQTQQYQIHKNPQAPQLKKSSSANQYSTKLFNSSLQVPERKAFIGSVKNNEPQKVQCVNNDGNTAKYMTIISQDDDVRLYYCSKCTVLLVSQGFILEEIKSKEQKQLSHCSQQLLSACQDRLKSLINDLQMRESFQLNKLDQFYQHLMDIVSQQKQRRRQFLKASYKQKIRSYQQILQSLSSDRFRQYEDYYHLVLQQRLGEPILKKYQNQELQKLKYEFYKTVHQKFSIITETKNILKHQVKETAINSNHGLRFSFQKLLHDINTNKSKVQNFIYTLQQQQSSQNDSKININEQKNRKTAFRDLFPQSEESVQVNCGVNSPTFKHI